MQKNFSYITSNHSLNASNSNYPFGMKIQKRSYSATSYRFGFNGKELDNEVMGEGNSYDFGARMYDSRLGRWFSVDPYTKEYPYVSPYNFAINSPVFFSDADGNVVIGKDRKPVIFEVVKDESGKFSFLLTSSNLDKESDAYALLSAMVLTGSGRTALKLMETSEIKYKTKKLCIETGGETPHGHTNGPKKFNDNRPKSPAITVFVDYEGMYRDRFKALEGLGIEFYLNNVMVHEVLGHCESVFLATNDAYADIEPGYALNLSKRVDNARAFNRTEIEEGTPLDKEDRDFKAGVMEYGQIQIDIGNAIDLLSIAYEGGELNMDDYNKRMGILHDTLIKLENAKDRVDQRKKEFSKKETKDE